jgi:hypothetical protein
LVLLMLTSSDLIFSMQGARSSEFAGNHAGHGKPVEVDRLCSQLAIEQTLRESLSAALVVSRTKPQLAPSRSETDAEGAAFRPKAVDSGRRSSNLPAQMGSLEQALEQVGLEQVRLMPAHYAASNAHRSVSAIFRAADRARRPAERTRRAAAGGAVARAPGG